LQLLQNQILQHVALYRYSIYDNFSDDLSPEKFAETRAEVRSDDFNPRIRVKRELFNHLRQMILAITCITIATSALYRQTNQWIDARNRKKKKSLKKSVARPSREFVAGSVEEDRVEEYLRSEHLLFNWNRPHQLLTPLACFHKGFNVEPVQINIFEEKPLRCNQSKEFIVLTA
ncbi:hypothetical protein PFISCL1PPCAC_23807, partial [Pristionchus fissidentatus]